MLCQFLIPFFSQYQPPEESEQPEQVLSEDVEDQEAAHEQEEAKQAEEAEEEPEDSRERLEILGYDANTHTRTLQQDPDQEPQELANRPPPVKVEGHPETPNTKKAYEALAAVDSLQAELL